MKSGEGPAEGFEYNIVQAHELAVARLNKKDRKIFDELVQKEDAASETLGRPLTSEDFEALEKSVPGALGVLDKIEDSLPFLIQEVVNKVSRKM